MWLVGTSLSSAGGSGPGTCQTSETPLRCLGNLLRENAVFMYKNGTSSTQYTIKSAGVQLKDQAAYTPAKFSIILGSGINASAPVPFCAAKQCDQMILTYQSGSGNKVGAQSLPLRDIPAYSLNAGSLPLSSVVGASSAAAGTLGQLQGTHLTNAVMESIRDTLTWTLDELGVPLNVTNFLLQEVLSAAKSNWDLASTMLPDGAAFRGGELLRQDLAVQGGPASKTLLADIAQESLHALVDGGITDNTGIGHAVAAGATEVIFFLRWLDWHPQSLEFVPRGAYQSESISFASKPCFNGSLSFLHDQFSAFPGIKRSRENAILQVSFELIIALDGFSIARASCRDTSSDYMCQPLLWHCWRAQCHSAHPLCRHARGCYWWLFQELLEAGARHHGYYVEQG